MWALSTQSPVQHVYFLIVCGKWKSQDRNLTENPEERMQVLILCHITFRWCCCLCFLGGSLLLISAFLMFYPSIKSHSTGLHCLNFPNRNWVSFVLPPISFYRKVQVSYLGIPFLVFLYVLFKTLWVLNSILLIYSFLIFHFCVKHFRVSSFFSNIYFVKKCIDPCLFCEFLYFTDEELLSENQNMWIQLKHGNHKSMLITFLFSNPSLKWFPLKQIKTSKYKINRNHTWQLEILIK